MALQKPGFSLNDLRSFSWHKFFSRPPLRSAYFLVSTVICLVCLILAILVLYRHWARLSPGEAMLMFLIICPGVVGIWWRTFQAIDQVRELYAQGLIAEVKHGSPLDMALTAAAQTSDLLFSGSLGIMFLLLYINDLLARCR